MYNAIDLAKYIVTECYSKENPISNLQLQKILYFVQRDFLLRDDIAFLESIEAWQFGPVVPVVYYHFCGYGAMPITDKYSVNISEEDKTYIDKIVDEKSTMNPWDLVAETHKPNGAWEKVYDNGAGNHNVISIELIKEAG
ncbi:hypothetical protein CSX00_09375 [Pseudobutyrivibrio ruminis]|uniref:Antitoxin SocA-like Panacea domain-containing protein n=1 Tax=Pseudobutyrivibrio ruminis TaxID=46206 RepID=A0A2G3E949_9FIRM|nr:type II toxin-antitoxin system antitoxin SocA domain-containing protein [Pseudobutyrivibrio ruminis]PHU39764.1 hypothetical protein CSX00_09375 [Pseudobutyrivibrio ruminis]